VIAHSRGQDHLAIGIGQRCGDTAAQRRHKGIGGAQIDTNRQTALVGLRALSGLSYLK